MIRYIKNFFLSPSTDKSKFLDGDKPNNSTFKKLFDSIPFIKERSDRAKTYGTDQCPQGLVVKNRLEDVKSRTNPMDTDASGLPFTYTIDAENLPEVSNTNTNDIDPNLSLFTSYPSVVDGGVTVTEDKSTSTKRSIWKIALSSSFVNWLLLKIKKFDIASRLSVGTKPVPNSVYDQSKNFQANVRGIIQIRVDENIAVDGTKTYWLSLTPDLIAELNRRIVDNVGPTHGSAAIYNSVTDTHDDSSMIKYDDRYQNAQFDVNQSPNGCDETRDVRRIAIGDDVKVNKDRKQLLSTFTGDYVDIGRRALFTEVGWMGRNNLYGQGATSNVYGMSDHEPVICDFRQSILYDLCYNTVNPCSITKLPSLNNRMFAMYPITLFNSEPPNGPTLYDTIFKFYYTDIDADDGGKVALYHFNLKINADGSVSADPTTKVGN